MNHGNVGHCPLCETTYIQCMLRRNEVHIDRNKSAISYVINKVHTQESNKDGEVALSMENLH
jgi:hypothetical protein